MRRPVAVAAAVAAAAVAVALFVLLTRPEPLDPRIADAYVQAQADALCIVQSNSYRTNAALQEAYRKAQAGAGLSAQDLARARTAAEKDVQLRRRVSARVMSIYSGVTYAGQNQVVSINRGSVDGLDIGSVLQLYNFGKTVTDPGGSKGMLGMGSPKLILPDEQYGTLFVFRVFKHVSYGLIMQVSEPVEVGDVAKSPE